MITEIISQDSKEILATNNTNTILTTLIELIDTNKRKAKSFMFEMTREVISKEINLENYYIIIDNLSKDHNDFLVTSIVDVLWLVGFGLEKKVDNVDKEMSQIYSNIINNLIKKKIVAQNVLLEKLEETSLVDSGLIQDKESFKKKITRVNTKITYEQQKYNLFREESEGFSKLLFLLFEVKLTKENLQSYINKILCLIGFFDLDPNRVLDIVLSAFEQDNSNLNFVEIIKILNTNALPHIIGFKLASKVDDSFSLFVITAHLIKYGLLDLQKIIPHLTPTDKEMEDLMTANITNTNSLYQSLPVRVMKDISSIATTNIGNINDNPNVTTINANYFVNFTDILNDINKPQDNNQRYRLFEGLIKARAWKQAELMFSLMVNVYDPIASPSLINTLCTAIDWMIEPIYKQFSFKNLFEKNKIKENGMSVDDTYIKDKQVETIEEFMVEIPRLLKYLTIGLSYNQIIFTKILRIVKSYSKVIFAKAEYISIIIDLLKKVFLPSLSLIDPTPSLVNELWNVISNFDYQRRYKIYNYWINNLYNTHPALYLKYGVVARETSKWQKTLTKDNQRQHGRTLGIMTNSNPTIVLDTVIRLLTNYDNQINIFIQTLSFISTLSYDVITFVIAKILADPTNEKLNTRSGEVASWFKYFSYFVGSFYKKYYFADFSGIFYYLCNKMKASTSNIIDLYVIKEVIEKMSGITIVEEMNESQVNSCAGGLYLFLESNTLIKDYKSLKKPIQALMKFFLQNSIVSNTSSSSNDMLVDNINDYNNDKPNPLSFTSVFLILLGIRRQSMLYNSGYSQTKLIGYLYDQIQNIYIQIVQFFTMHSDRETYSKLLPNWSLEKYVINYNCQPEVIYFMIRNQIKPIYEMTEEEYQNNIMQFCTVLDTYQSINNDIFNNEFESLYLDKQAFLGEIYKNIWNYITKELYFIFSCLQLQDIYVPKSRYETEIAKNNKIILDLTEENKTVSESQAGKNKKEIDKCNINIENLKKEMNGLIKNHDSIIKFIENKKATLLEGIPKNNKREISKYFIQFCLYPRLVFSKVEALFAAKMLVLLINLKIQNINVFDIMQKMIKFILPTILCVTEFEAQNIGLFLLEFLKVVNSWQDEKTWEEECVSNPCFSRNLDTASSVDISDFKKVNIILLGKMNDTFQNIFKSDDYMSCRNALIVLNSISAVYPPTREVAVDLTTSLTNALDKFSSYEDLFMMMKRYRDILTTKTVNLPAESDISGDKSEKDKSAVRANGDKKKKKEKEKEKSKEREKEGRKRNTEESKTPDTKRRSPGNNIDEHKSKKQK